METLNKNEKLDKISSVVTTILSIAIVMAASIH